MEIHIVDPTVVSVAAAAAAVFLRDKAVLNTHTQPLGKVGYGSALVSRKVPFANPFCLVKVCCCILLHPEVTWHGMPWCCTGILGLLRGGRWGGRFRGRGLEEKTPSPSPLTVRVADSRGVDLLGGLIS